MKKKQWTAEVSFLRRREGCAFNSFVSKSLDKIALGYYIKKIFRTIEYTNVFGIICVFIKKNNNVPDGLNRVFFRRAKIQRLHGP